MEHINYNYDNYVNDLSTIVYDIEKANIHYDVVVGIVRGGLIPAVQISNIFNATFIPLNWSSNVSRVRDKDNNLIIEAINRHRNILVVDDICDSGVTFDDVTKAYQGVHTACLIYNNVNKRNFTPTYYGWEINRNEIPEWFDFWWEKK
jgi:hypoxanthine phosphoribosyltransferase